MAQYTPEQREVIRKGMRIWTRVAIRSYMRRWASSLSRPESATADNDECPFSLTSRVVRCGAGRRDRATILIVGALVEFTWDPPSKDDVVKHQLVLTCR